MRCINCGYVNEDTESHCIKCHAELSPKPAGSNQGQGGAFQPSKTFSEAIVPNEVKQPQRKRPEPQKPTKIEVEKPLEPHTDTDWTPDYAKSCPAERPSCAEPQNTINVWESGDVKPIAEDDTPRCWLASIDYKPASQADGLEQPKGNLLECCGEEFELMRQNTNPNDNAISNHQALLTHDAEGWHIEDTSSFQSTTIVVTKRTKLNEGDIIAFGTSRFVFTEKKPQ